MRFQGIKKFFKLIKTAYRSPIWTTLSLICAFLSSAAIFMPYLCIRQILEEALNQTGGNLVLYGVLAFIGVAANVILYFVSLIFSHVASFNIAYEMKLSLSEHLAGLPLSYTEEKGSGALYGVLDGSVGKVTSFVAHQLPDMVTAICTPVFLAIVMFMTDWRYSLVALGAITFAYIFNLLSNGSGGSKEAMEVYLEALERMSAESVEYARGIKEIKMYGHTQSRFNKLQKNIKEYTAICIPYTLVWEKYRCVFEGMIRNIYLFIVPFGILFLSLNPEKSSITAFIFFMILTSSVASHFSKLGGLMHESYRAQNEADKIDELKSAQKEEHGSIDRPDGSSVKFSDVSFSYGESSVLSNVTFTANEGRMTAIVGESGSGKTTLAMLLAGLRHPDSGEIFIGNTRLSDLSAQGKAQSVSAVIQDPFLFSQSIYENIAGGVKDADKDMIISAAKRANCHDFIERLPGGYDTVLGESGFTLSGGEKQRIAIARAMVKNAPVLVLDEVTSAADPENEAYLQGAIQELVKDKTVIVIAHRLSSVKRADKIIVLNEGRIEESGRHEELLAKRGRYADMWKTYMQVINWEIKDENIRQ